MPAGCGSDHPNASTHLEAAKDAAISATDNTGTAISEVAQAAQSYASDEQHKFDNDKPTISEHYNELREQASGHLHETQRAAEDTLRSFRRSADEQAERTRQEAADRIEQGQQSTEEALHNISGTVHGQLQAAGDAASSVAASATNQLKDVKDVAVSNLDRGIGVASQGLKSATSAAVFGTQQAATQARVYMLFWGLQLLPATCKLLLNVLNVMRAWYCRYGMTHWQHSIRLQRSTCLESSKVCSVMLCSVAAA